LFEQEEGLFSGNFDFAKQDIWRKIDRGGGCVIWVAVGLDLGAMVA
jgi:hypothetical protein